jgi:hypothetical protein
MKIQKTVFFLGSVWETFRFVILFFIVLSITGSYATLSRLVGLGWLGSVQLVLVAGFLFLGFFPYRYGLYSKLLALAKLLNIFPAVILLVSEVLLLIAPDGAGMERFLNAPSGLQQLVPLIAVITLLDLLFFIFLLSYSRKVKVNSSMQKKNNEHNNDLPLLKEVSVEEE